LYPSNAYVIRRATDGDEVELHRLAELDGQRPLTGPALVGEIEGKPAAAVSAIDGRVIADPFQHTAVLRQMLRIRLSAMRSYARTPSLAERMREALQPFMSAHGRTAPGTR
jgi:hypothetical protein